MTTSSSTTCKSVSVGCSLTLCSYLEVESSDTHSEHNLADGNLFGLLVLALEVELEDGAAPEPLGHCSHRCD